MIKIPVKKICYFIILAFFVFAKGAYAQEKNISLDCEFPRGFSLDFFKDKHPHLFDTTRLRERYARENIPIPGREELEVQVIDMFLFDADLRIRSIETNKDFGDPQWINLGDSIVQLPGDEAEWTSTHLNFNKYMPAFSIHYRINRSDLTFSASYRSFPPIPHEFIYWRGDCVIVEEPENRF